VGLLLVDMGSSHLGIAQHSYTSEDLGGALVVLDRLDWLLQSRLLSVFSRFHFRAPKAFIGA
jgi:hypothetical protein